MKTKSAFSWAARSAAILSLIGSCLWSSASAQTMTSAGHTTIGATGFATPNDVIASSAPAHLQGPKSGDKVWYAMVFRRSDGGEFTVNTLTAKPDQDDNGTPNSQTDVHGLPWSAVGANPRWVGIRNGVLQTGTVTGSVVDTVVVMNWQFATGNSDNGGGFSLGVSFGATTTTIEQAVSYRIIPMLTLGNPKGSTVLVSGMSAGKSYQLETSTDLLDWDPITTFVGSAGTRTITPADFIVVNPEDPRRFWRLRFSTFIPAPLL